MSTEGQAWARGPLLSAWDTFQHPQWMPKITNGPEPYI